MATQITNRASLTFQYGTLTGSAVSNVASTTFQGPLSIEKTAVAQEYTGQDDVTFVLSFTNGTSSTLSNVTISDNLGSYTVSSGSAIATPLSYVAPAALYLNGSFVSYLQGQTGPNSVSFNVGSVGVGDNVLVVYKTTVNDYAPLAPSSTITNTAVVTADGITETASASNTLNIGSYADVSIVKSMTPDPVSSGDTITYNFALYNYGNTLADNVVLRDLFSPAPVISSVSVNGNIVAPSEYTYIGGDLTLPVGSSTLSIPAATYTQDDTGLVTKTPGLTTVTVIGTI